MPKTLNQLTPEQVAQLPVVREEWLAHGLSTAPANRQAAQDSMTAAYAEVGLPAPRFHIWVDSPYAGAFAQAYLKCMLESGRVAPVRDQVWDQVGDQVRAQVWDQVGDQVWAQVRDQVGDQVRAQVGDQVRDQVGDQVRNWTSGLFWGQHYAGWLSFYGYFRQQGLTCCDRMAGMMGVAQSCGWAWMYSGAAIYTERPNVLSRDEQGRLHSDTGMAIGYPDGWGVYAIHGVRVTEQIVLRPETLTVEQIEAEQNSEIRRVMMDRFGAERFIRESGAECVHTDDFGTLYHRLVADDEPVVMVQVVNSTPEPDGTYKDYWLRVDPSLRPLLSDGKFGEPQRLTAHNAVASTFGLRGEEYAPLVQT